MSSIVHVALKKVKKCFCQVQYSHSKKIYFWEGQPCGFPRFKLFKIGSLSSLSASLWVIFSDESFVWIYVYPQVHQNRICNCSHVHMFQSMSFEFVAINIFNHLLHGCHQNDCLPSCAVETNMASSIEEYILCHLHMTAVNSISKLAFEYNIFVKL